MKKYIFLITIITTLCFVCRQVYAQDAAFQNRLNTIEYNSLSGFALGDGVIFESMNSPAGNCIDLASSPIKKDSPGAVVVKAKIDVVSNAEQLESSLERSMLIEAGIDGGLKDIATFDIDGTSFKSYTRFIDEQSSSLLVTVKLYADYGRDILDYNLKSDKAALLAGSDDDIDKFVSLCGTHFIRAVQRQASIDLTMKVSNLSSDEKETLINNATLSLKGDGTFSNGFKLGGYVSVDSKLKEFERLASQFGSVSIDIQGTGAPGLAAFGPVIYSDGKEARINEYLNKLRELVKEFATTDGAPKQYILLKYPSMPDDRVDYQKFYQLDRILKLYILSKAYSDYYENIRRNDTRFWSDHFQTVSTNLYTKQEELKTLYSACIEREQCSLKLTPLEPPLTLEDVLTSGQLVATCGNDIVAMDGVKPVQVLSDIAIVWKGKINFPNYIGLDDIEAFLILKDGQKVEFNSFRSSRDFSVDPNFIRSVNRPLVKGPGRAIAQIVNEKIIPNRAVTDGSADFDYLSTIRSEFGDNLYGLNFKYKDGSQVSQIIGKPDMRNCILSEEIVQ